MAYNRILYTNRLQLTQYLIKNDNQQINYFII